MLSNYEEAQFMIVNTAALGTYCMYSTLCPSNCLFIKPYCTTGMETYCSCSPILDGFSGLLPLVLDSRGPCCLNRDGLRPYQLGLDDRDLAILAEMAGDPTNWYWIVGTLPF